MKRKRIPSNPYANKYSVSKKSRTSTLSANRIPRTLKEFPSQMRVKLKYVALFNAPVTSSAPGAAPGYAAAFRCNSPYDPDAAVGGSAATGFSQWSQFYQRYTVVGSTITVRLMDQDTGTGTGGTCNGLFGVSLKDSAVPVVTPTQLNLITDTDSVHKGWDSYHANQTVSYHFNAAKYFGVNNLLDSSELSGGTGTTVGSNPAQQAFFYMWISQAPASGAASQAMLAEVYISYDVIFSLPADL